MTDHSPRTAEAEFRPPRFSSLREIHDLHGELLKVPSRDSVAPDYWDRVEALVAGACAAGAQIEDDADRRSAQSIVTYWSNALYRADREPATTLLEEFDEKSRPELPDDLCPYGTLSQAASAAISAASGSGLAGFQRLIKECLEKLEHHHVIVLLGQPGSGRGTLHHLGVLPRLRESAEQQGLVERILPEFAPKLEPLRELLQHLSPGAAADQAEASLLADPTYLKRLLDQGGAGRAVLSIARFERFLSIGQAPLDAVCRNLETLLAHSEHRVILKLRYDFLADAASHELLRHILDIGQVLVVLTASELRQLIEVPARAVNLHFEPGLVDRLVQDLQGDSSAVEMLHFTMRRLWHARERNLITWAAYRRLGAGQAAVTNVAEQVFLQQRERRSERLIRSVWSSLIRLNIGREPRAHQAPRGDIHRDAQTIATLRETPSSVIDTTLQELVDAQLLRVTPGATAAEDEFTIAYESLLRCWKRLFEWIEEIRDEYRRWLRLRTAALQWQDGKESRDLLWGGESLAEAEQEPRLQLPEFDLERRFVAASRAWVQEREEAQAMQWRIRVALAGAVLVSIVAGFVAHTQQQKEIAETKMRVSRQAAAKTSLELAIASTVFGQRSSGIGFQDADEPGGLLWYQEALRLVRENIARAPHDDVEAILNTYQTRLAFAFRQSVQVSHFFPTDRTFVETAMSANGRWVLLVERVDEKEKRDKEERKPENFVRLVDLRSPSGAAPTGDTTMPGAIKSARFSRQGDYIVAGADGTETQPATVSLWRLPNTAGNSQVRRLGTWTLPSTRRRISQVAISVDDGLVRLLAVTPASEKENSISKVIYGTAVPQQELAGDFRERGELTALEIKDTPRPSAQASNQAPRQSRAKLPEPTLAPAAAAEFSLDGQFFVIRSDADASGNAWAAVGYSPQSKYLRGGDQVPLTMLAGVEGPINHVAFAARTDATPDSYVVITCSGKLESKLGAVQRWEFTPASEGLARELSFPRRVGTSRQGAVLHAAASPDAKRVALSMEEGGAVLFDMETWHAEPALPHPGVVFASAFSPDGQWLATLCRDRKARIWDLPTRSLLATLDCGGSGAQASFSEDGLRLFVQGSDDRAIVWDLLTNATPPQAVPVAGDVTATAISPDGLHTAIITRSDSDRGAWQATISQLDQQGHSHLCWTAANRTAEFSPARVTISAIGNSVAVDDSTVILVRSAQDSDWTNLPNDDLQVTHLTFSPDGTRLLAVGRNSTNGHGEARLWRTKTPDRWQSDGGLIAYDLMAEDLKEPLVFGAFSADGTRMLTCGGSDIVAAPKGVASVWQVDGDGPAKRTHALVGHASTVVFGVFSSTPESPYLVTTSTDNSACVWKCENVPPGGEEFKKLDPYRKLASEQGKDGNTADGHTADVVAAAFAPKNESIVVTAGQDGRVVVWNWQVKSSIILDPGGGPLNAILFNRIGTHFLAVSRANTCYVWDYKAAAGKFTRTVVPLVAVLKHTSPLVAATFHPSDERSFRTWEQLLPLRDPPTLAAVTSPSPAPPISPPTSTSAPSPPPPLPEESPNAPPSGNGVRLYVHDWNLNPLSTKEEESLPQSIAVLTQRRVERDKQKLVTMPREELAAQAQALPFRTNDSERALRQAAWNRAGADFDEKNKAWYSAAWHLGQLFSQDITENDRAELLLRRARCWTNLGRHEQAIRDWKDCLKCESIVESESRRGQVHAGLARAYAALSKPTRQRPAEPSTKNSADAARTGDALLSFQLALAAFPKDVNLRRERAEFLVTLGVLDEAQRDFRDVLESLGEDATGKTITLRAELNLSLAHVALELRQTTEAMDRFQEAARLFQTIAPKRAIEVYEEALDNVPTDRHGSLLKLCGEARLAQLRRYRLTDGVVFQEQARRADVDIQESERKGAMIERSLYRNLASVLEQAQQFDGAIRNYDKAIRSGYPDAPSHEELAGLNASLATALISQRDPDWKRAVECWSQTIALSPNIDRQRLARSQRASCYAELSDWKHAEADLDQLARDYAASRQFEDAITCRYQCAVVQLSMPHLEAYQSTCQILEQMLQQDAQQTGDMHRALVFNDAARTFGLDRNSQIAPVRIVSLATKAHHAAPDSEAYRNTLRLAYFRGGRYDDVVKSWHESPASKVRTGDSALLATDQLILAMTHYRLKRPVEARKLLQETFDQIERLQRRRRTPSERFFAQNKLSIWQQLEIQALYAEAVQVLGEGD